MKIAIVTHAVARNDGQGRVNLEIVEAYLLDNGYRVDCVSSGLEAIQMLGANDYDLIKYINTNYKRYLRNPNAYSLQPLRP